MCVSYEGTVGVGTLVTRNIFRWVALWELYGISPQRHGDTEECRRDTFESSSYPPFSERRKRMGTPFMSG